MNGRIPNARARCSLDVRPSAASQQAGARRPSIDVHPLTPFAATASGGWHSCSHATAQRGSSALQAVADAQRQDTFQLRVEGSGEAPPAANPAANNLPRVLIAGAGIGGLVLAVALLKRGFKVQIFERDLTAIRGEGKYRGPIQVQSNALAALEAIDMGMAGEVLDNGCITGDRVNGLCDGVTGDWYCKFDTFHPAADNGLPVTRVISRVTLQQTLSDAVVKYGGEHVVMNDCFVTDFEEVVDEATGKQTVVAQLEDGRRFEGDLLVGADGIWSKVRTQLIGPSEPCYSAYTCYTGISDFMPPDIDTVGYRVFLGNGKYFVSSDVGDGKMQWYGFHKEAAGGKDVVGQQKERLLDIFGHWCDNVTDLIRATPEVDVIRRDIYDRPPIFKWTEGRVALLGDSAHAMQPNLGQGGCMAIEDGYELALTLSEAVAGTPAGKNVDVKSALQSYQSKRMMRASTIHGLAGMAAIMASTYKAYLGEGLPEPINTWLQKFKIPHPGRVGGKIAMDLTMPAVLGWVLGGNVAAFKDADRASHCRIADKPKAFDQSMFDTFMHDEDALLRAANAQWALVPASYTATGTGPTHEPALLIDEGGVIVGSALECGLLSDTASVSPQHARVEKRDGDHVVTDLGSAAGTWLNDRKLEPNAPHILHPGDILQFGLPSEAEKHKVKMFHRSKRQSLERAFNTTAAAGLGLATSPMEPTRA